MNECPSHRGAMVGRPARDNLLRSWTIVTNSILFQPRSLDGYYVYLPDGGSIAVAVLRTGEESGVHGARVHRLWRM